jgi:hypothetical protein
MIFRTVIGLIAFLVSSAAQAQFYTYQTWSAMSEPFRAVYIAGAYDTLALTTGSDETAIRAWLHYLGCTTRSQMTTWQLSAGVLNFARDKPQFHTGLVQQVLIAYLNAACGEPPKK